MYRSQKHRPPHHGGKFRGGSKRHFPSTSERDGIETTVEEIPGPSRRQSKPKHPPHLKGRAIGMFYANLNKKERNHKIETETIPHVELDGNIIFKIKQILDNCQQASLQATAESSHWKEKYENLNDSNFKKKFLEVLHGNEDSHFAKDSLLRNPTDSLERNEELDLRLKRLPVYERIEEILKAIEQNQVIVIKGETGCGKTTQVAQFILDHYIESKKGSMFHAICTQPRRLAAISVAQRVAQERCEPCGNSSSSVGYQIRLECRSPRRKGSILYCTTGILVQFLQSDPYLENVSHLLIDEVHERDVLSDFILTIVRDLLPKRPNLRVILMSATLNADMFSKYFNDCQSIEIPGLTFPVKDFYLEDILTLTDFRVRPKHPKRFRPPPGSPSFKDDVEYTKFIVSYVEELEAKRSYPCHVLKSLRMRESEEAPDDLILELLHHICTQEGPGAILIFLSGWEQISRLHRTLTADRFFSTSRFLVIPLHSMMPTVNQRQVFDRPPRGTRKIILSTNIAETSLTIDDVVYVIDTGRTKQSGFDAKKNLSTLQSEWIALANARQRRGRAGRVQPGVCYRLYSRFREASFMDHPVPEMQRMRLEEVILRIKILKLGQVEVFLQHVPEVPDPKTVQVSLELLRTLGALDEEERLTPLGFHLAQLPVDPRTGKLILMGAIFGCLEPILSIAAALSFKDPFVIPLNKEDLVRQTKKALAKESRSDHLLIARVLYDYRMARSLSWSDAKEYCHRHFLSSSTMSMLCNMCDQFAKDLHERQFIATPSIKDRDANTNSRNNQLIRAILCAGLFPSVAKVKMIRRKGKPSARPRPPIVRTPEDGKVEIHPKSLNYNESEFESPWLVYHTKVKTTAIFLHDCSEISPVALIFFGGRIKKRDNSRRQSSGTQIVDIGPDVAFRCQQSTAELIETLRNHLDNLLSYRVSHPGPTDWSTCSPYSAVLRAIVELLTAEEGRSYNYVTDIKTPRNQHRFFDEKSDEDSEGAGDVGTEDDEDDVANSGHSQLLESGEVPDQWEERCDSGSDATSEDDDEKRVILGEH